jgi:hypothetical protein
VLQKQPHHFDYSAMKFKERKQLDRIRALAPMVKSLRNRQKHAITAY